MTLGQKLKEIRKRFGLSQESLAEKTNDKKFVYGKNIYKQFKKIS